MKNDQLLRPTQDVPQLIELIDELMIELKAANLASIAALRRFDGAFDVLICLDFNDRYLSSSDWNLDAPTKYALRQIAKKVIEEAKTAKYLLRKAALKSYVISGEERLFLRRIFVLLTDIKLSLLHIHSELFRVKDLALFDFTKTILR